MSLGAERDHGRYELRGAPRSDTLQYQRLRPHRTDLDYRPWHPRDWGGSLGFLLGASGVALGFVYFAQQFGWRLTGAFLTPFWLAGLLAMPFYFLVRRQDLRLASLWVVGIAGVFLLLRLVQLAAGGWTPIAYGLVAAGVVALVGVLDRIGTHTIEWVCADPALARETAATLLERWRARLLPGARQTRAEIDAGPPSAEAVAFRRAVALYPVRLVGALLLATLPACAEASLLAAFALVVVVLAWTVVIEGWAALDASGEALHLFLHYGVTGERAPGVLRTSAGSILARQLSIAVTMALLSAAFAAPAGLPFLRHLYYRYTGAPYPLFFTIAGSLLVPLALFGGALLLVLGPVLARLHALARAASRPEVAATPEAEDAPTPPTAWDAYVERIQTSANPMERAQLLVGFHASEDYPIYLPISALEGHAHILGASRSGKTSRGVDPLVTQLIRRGRDTESERAPVVIIDMKGDPALFQGARHEARRAGRTFRYFTNVAGRATFLFNPLGDLQARRITLSQVCQVLLNALNLEHGWGYGPGYFSALGRDWLTKMLARPNPPQTFEALAELAADRNVTTTDEEREAFEVISTVRGLARLPALNLDAAHPPEPAVSAAAIHMPTALEENHVLYFWLDPALEEATARQVAGLALYALYTACKERADMGRKKRTYLVIDEFQSVAGRNFSQVIQKAGGAGLSLILCNQEREALRIDARTDLFKILEESTNYRQFFTARSPELRLYLQELSGESIYLQQSWSEQRVSSQTTGKKGTSTTTTSRTTHTKAEQMGPRFQPNDLIELGADEEIAFVLMPAPRDFSLFAGYLQAARCPFHISATEFARRETLAWPVEEPGTLTPPVRPTLAHPLEAALASQAKKRTLPPIVPDSPLAARYATLTPRKDAHA